MAAAVPETYGVVESWTEWDALREVWVGTLDHKHMVVPNESAAKRKGANYDKYKWPLRNGLSKADCLVEAKVELEGFVEQLKAEGVAVRRPTSFPTDQDTKTPLWSVECMGGFTCPRDVYTVVGKQVLEATMSWKSRYFEHLAWRDLMLGYYGSDPRMRWTCAPKPAMLASSFKEDGELTNEEILFDAADCQRFGKDVFMQAHYGTANGKGRDWVRRELHASGVRVQDFDFDEFHFSHLDARIAPVDEALCLYIQSDKPTDAVMKLFKENEWNMLEVGNRLDCRTAADATTMGINVNYLCLAPGVVMVESHETNVIRKLRDEGCDIIPVPFSAAYPFGGGLHCFTLDVYRHGPAAKSYFPTLDVLQERQAERAAKDDDERKRQAGPVAQREAPRRVKARLATAKA